MELLGKSLEDIFENVLQKKKMSLRCVCNLGIQMIEILEFIHNKNIIHRDIKPDNFLMSNGSNKYLYLLDFGLAKKYRESNNSKHFPLVQGKKLTGTARYASVNALNGVTQSRRDDLESVGYVLLYFLKGKLPWQGIMIKNKEERYNRIMEIKRDIKSDELCKDCPNEFQQYIDYIRKLKYEEDPDYEMLKNLFKSALKKNGFEFDYFYDWDTSQTIYDFNCFNNNKDNTTDKNNENDEDINKAKIAKDNSEEENNLDLPLDKIYYRKKNRKKRNKSQDKSTADGVEEEVESENNSIGKSFIQNHNGCCTIM
jgi:serine/threonine protein kinase